MQLRAQGQTQPPLAEALLLLGGPPGQHEDAAQGSLRRAHSIHSWIDMPHLVAAGLQAEWSYPGTSLGQQTRTNTGWLLLIQAD